MAEPVFVDCPKNAWTKVATNVTSGFINIVKDDIAYLQTYKMTGVNPAPTLKSVGVKIYDPQNPSLRAYQQIIKATAGIDIYIWAENSDGKVRVDII